jgi:hypothetical protein
MTLTKVDRLIVVRDPHRTPKFKCMVPDCDAVFYDGEMKAWESHVVSCAERNREKVELQSVRNRDPELFNPLHPNYQGDLDLSRWIREHQQAIIEGRKRM